MGYTATQLVKIAEAEIGYHEKASNSNLDSKTANSGSKNYTKYGRDLFNAGFFNGNKNGFDWCAQFPTWCVCETHWQGQGKSRVHTMRWWRSECGLRLCTQVLQTGWTL